MAQNPMKNQGPGTPNAQQNAQAGSVLTIILIAVALFAALSWVMMEGSRTTGSLASDQSMKLAASELIEYAESVRTAVKTLKINGCTDAQISFESPATGTTFTNPSTPADGTCKVFNPNGGGLRHQKPEAASSINYVGRTALDGIGVSGCGNESCSDLYITYGTLDFNKGRDLCAAFNKLLGNTDLVPTPATAYMYTSGAFTGTYGPYHAPSGTVFKGKKAACFNYSPSPSQHLFYYTVLAR